MLYLLYVVLDHTFITVRLLISLLYGRLQVCVEEEWGAYVTR